MDDITILTVGRVSSLIALGNTILTITFPLLIVLLLVRYNNTTMSAASWSVLARQLHSTAWPSLLQSDSAVTKNVQRGVTIVSYVKMVLVLLGIVSGIVTPLGLGDQIRPGSSRPVRFDYVPDLSSFGKSTMARPDMPLSRECLIEAGILCPGAFVPGLVQNTSGYYFLDPNAHGTTRIPENITTMFTSVSDNSSVAGIFDLQYRTWAPFKTPLFDNNRPYPRGRFVHIDSLLSHEGLVAVEGLVADMTAGGLGFRNHSAPVGTAYGAEWTEDILWIEPEVSCANTNLSIMLTLGGVQKVESIEVVDDGGFARLPHGQPEWLNLTYSSPSVRLRAETTAWASNLLTAMNLNITDGLHAPYGLNVTEGRRYPITKSSIWSGMSALGILTTRLNVDWLGLPAKYSHRNWTFTVGNRTISHDVELYKICEMVNLDLHSYSNVECSYLFASPRRIDNGFPYEQAGSQWKSSIFVCSGAVKASVKTATFRINGTESLQNLVVRGVLDRSYGAPSSYPLWATEDWRYPGSDGAHFAPLWGIVDNSYEGTRGYNFTRAPSFYLPFSSQSAVDGPARDIIAGIATPYEILKIALNRAFETNGINSKLPRYSGSDKVILQNKWRNFSSNSDVESIIRLVWTDMMASTVVSTNMSPPQLATVFDHRVTYDLRYAVPAILTLILWTLLLLMSFSLGVYRNNLIPNLKQLMNYTSVGRTAVSLTNDNHKHLRQASTRDWVNNAGQVPIHLGHDSGNIIGSQQVSSGLGQQN